ncbi:MAG: PEP/pyruvate-binding domain-containing protein, partial [Myxococcota bacterium]|nr:PEP/pyruvate-binding domain-containing protein [Myxococcota bacterium]
MRRHIFITVFSCAALAACGDGGPASSGDTGTQDSQEDATTASDTSTDSGAPDTEPTEWVCVNEEPAPDYLRQLGCIDDFEVVASAPLDASIPGARSTKTVIDRFDGDAFYVQNATTYALHYEFCIEHLSGQGLPPVGAMAQFNQTEYYSPDRRFLLGILTRYEEPGVWVYEIEPWDTMTAEMIQAGFEIVKANTYFGDELYFHPASEAIAVEATKLPASVPVITTDELFAGVTYQPLNLGTSTGKLRFLSSDGLASSDLNYRDIVVLDHVPNDIGVVSGIITGKHQTPLSHINVLSQNRGTPNMALIGAFEDETLTGLDGTWVELTVGAFEWSIREITQEEADAWWEANKPEAIDVPPVDLSVTEVTDIEDLLPFDGPRDVDNVPTAEDLEGALAQAIPAFGGKASHYAGFTYMGEVDQAQTDDTSSLTGSAPWQSMTIGIKGYLERIAVHATGSEGTLRLYEGEGVDGTLRREQPIRLAPDANGWAWVRLIDDLKVAKDDVWTVQLDLGESGGQVGGATGDPYPAGISSDGADADMAFKAVITKVRHPKAFAIPIYWYRDHMATNGLDVMVDEMLADPEFQGSASVRADRLDALQDAIKDAPINPALLEAVTDKMMADFGNIRMRFRSSTNAEDLGGFTGAGLYTSNTGDLNDPDRPPEEAIKKV